MEIYTTFDSFVNEGFNFGSDKKFTSKVMVINGYTIYYKGKQSQRDAERFIAIDWRGQQMSVADHLMDVITDVATLPNKKGDYVEKFDNKTIETIKTKLEEFDPHGKKFKQI